jgi:hypothetical protein
MYVIIICHTISGHVHIVCILMLVGMKKAEEHNLLKFGIVKLNLYHVISWNFTFSKNVTIKLSKDLLY